MDTGQARRLADQLMTQHLDARWKFRFDSAKSRFGCCWHSRHLITISLALTEVNEVSEVRDTILHEIAHALVGSKAGHGNEWKAKAREIGARPERCYSSKRVVAAPKAWRGVCTNNCGYVAHKDRRTRDADCPRCFMWKWNNRDTFPYEKIGYLVWHRTDGKPVKDAERFAPLTLEV